jgi:signal transduction histidine kinase/ligand-binding sensor domain-containing protein
MFLKITTINSDQGLPNEQVHTARQDKYGRLWMATPAGLACYNGNKIKVYDTRTGLECLGLRTLNISDDAIVWIGTDRGLEAINIDGTKIDLVYNFDWKYGIADSVFRRNGFIYIGTSYGLLKVKKTNNVLDIESTIEMGLVKQIIAKDKTHLFIVSAKYGLVEYDGSTWKIVNSLLPKGDLITYVKKTIDNYLLVGSFEGLFVLNNEQKIVDEYFLPNHNKKITAIAVLGDEWWLAFNHTIVLVKPTATGIKMLEYTDVKSIINDLFVDNINNIWIATNNAGLKKISILRKSLRQLDCGINNSAFSIKEINQQKNLLIGGDGFCSIISPHKKTDNNNVILISTLPSIVWDICIDPIKKGLIWLATVDGLYCSKNGATPERFEDKNNIITSPNRVLITRNDEIWLGTISGLFKIKNNEPIEILNDKGQKFGYVYSLSLDEENKLLVGTLGQGFWREKEDKMLHIVTELLSELGNTYSISTNKNGEILIIQEEKLLLLDKNNNTKLITTEHPIAGWTSIWLNDKTIATGSNDGIIIFDKENGKVLQRINLQLSKADWQFTSTRALYAGEDDKLYCGLNSGLFVVDYKKMQTFNVAPKVQLDELIWQNASPRKNEIGYKVPLGNWSINVSVFVAWFTDEKQVSFRFKLIGFNETWTELSDNPSIRFSSLPVGKYELQCQAYTPLTGYGKMETVILLNVYSPWGPFSIAPFISKMTLGITSIFKSSKRNRELLEKNKDLQIEIRERQIAEQTLNKYKEQLEEIVENRTKELKYQKERAESADKMKTVFLSNMSHEIRTPLGVVIGLNKLLQRTNPNKIQLDYIEKIDSSANHLLQVINDVLDIAKIESGKINMQQLPFTINEIVKDFYHFASLNLGEKYVAFFVESTIITKNNLIGDALKIKQVLLNLLSNAFKFTEKGKVILSITERNIDSNNTLMHFSVKDSGIGMTEEQLQNIFLAFEQGDSTISRKYGGTGLGLNICDKFISLMGGELKVKSEIGKSTEFYFSIPFAISNQINEEEESIDLSKKTYKNDYPAGFDAIRKAKILVAEDDVLNQFIIKEILQSEGFNTVIVNNGEECVNAFNKEKDFDLILMDIQMPLMDGFLATSYIRSEIGDKDIKIIGVSSNTLSESSGDMLASGMNDFISKPIQLNELFSIMVKWIKVKK